MADEKYFARIIAEDIGVGVDDLTGEMINDYIDRTEKKATSSASETASLIGICTPIAHRVNLGICRLMSRREELKLLNYIPNWRK